MDKVIFKKFPEGDIIAIFPELLGTFDPNDCLSYMHIGQHGACDSRLIRELESASAEEYQDLWEELESIGYELELIGTGEEEYYWGW